MGENEKGKKERGIVLHANEKVDFDKNYIVLQGWMVRLGLTPSELMLFALIRGFCSYSGATFKGSLAYIRAWMGCGQRTIVRLLESLIEKNLIKRVSGGGWHTSEYQVNWEFVNEILEKKLEGPEDATCAKMTQVTCAKMTQGGVKMTQHCCAKMTQHYNINNNSYTDKYNDYSLHACAHASTPLTEEEQRREKHDQEIGEILQHDWVNDDDV